MGLDYVGWRRIQSFVIGEVILLGGIWMVYAEGDIAEAWPPSQCAIA